jgi:hypothetical protein
VFVFISNQISESTDRGEHTSAGFFATTCEVIRNPSFEIEFSDRAFGFALGPDVMPVRPLLQYIG